MAPGSPSGGKMIIRDFQRGRAIAPVEINIGIDPADYWLSLEGRVIIILCSSACPQRLSQGSQSTGPQNQHQQRACPDRFFHRSLLLSRLPGWLIRLAHTTVVQSGGDGADQ